MNFINNCLSDPPQAVRTFVLCSREDGVVRGRLDLRRVRPHHVEFGYALVRRWWGQGLMTEALHAAIDWALAEQGC